MGGIFVHNKKKYQLDHCGMVALGSLPAAAVTLWILESFKADISGLNSIIKYSLGWALLFTPIAIIFKRNYWYFLKNMEINIS